MYIYIFFFILKGVFDKQKYTISHPNPYNKLLLSKICQILRHNLGRSGLTKLSIIVFISENFSAQY